MTVRGIAARTPPGLSRSIVAPRDKPRGGDNFSRTGISLPVAGPPGQARWCRCTAAWRA